MSRIPHGHTLFQTDLDFVRDTAAAELETLRGARLFITGGTGFFGIWLVESLLYASETMKLGLDLTVLSRDPARFLAGRGRHLRDRAGVRFVAGRLTDFPTDGGPYSHILHAASETNLEGAGDWASRFIAGTLDGTTRLVDMAAAHKSEALLVTTSGAVYLNPERMIDGRFAEGPAGLADLVSEKSVYGQGKRMMEIMTAVGAKDHGFRGLIARCFAFVGPYLPLDSNYAVGNFIRDALNGEDIVVGGDGTPLRSYMYAADLASWLVRILVRGETGTPYNVGGAEIVSIGDLAHRVARASGGRSQVVIRRTPVPGVQPSAYVCDVSRAETQLGLINGVSLDEALARTIAWNRARDAARQSPTE